MVGVFLHIQDQLGVFQVWQSRYKETITKNIMSKNYKTFIINYKKNEVGKYKKLKLEKNGKITKRDNVKKN